jgi:hypothetical protein
MEKRITSAVSQLDEAEAFVALEPFNRRIDGRGGGHAYVRRRKPATEGRARLAPGLVTVIHRAIIVEAALPWPKVLTLAHVFRSSPPKVRDIMAPNSGAHVPSTSERKRPSADPSDN